MKILLASATAGLLGLGAVYFQPSLPCSAAENAALAGRNPAEELPPHIRRLQFFGERARSVWAQSSEFHSASASAGFTLK